MVLEKWVLLLWTSWGVMTNTYIERKVDLAIFATMLYGAGVRRRGRFMSSSITNLKRVYLIISLLMKSKYQGFVISCRFNTNIDLLERGREGESPCLHDYPLLFYKAIGGEITITCH